MTLSRRQGRESDYLSHGNVRRRTTVSNVAWRLLFVGKVSHGPPQADGAPAVENRGFATHPKFRDTSARLLCETDCTVQAIHLKIVSTNSYDARSRRTTARSSSRRRGSGTTCDGERRQAAFCFCPLTLWTGNRIGRTHRADQFFKDLLAVFTFVDVNRQGCSFRRSYHPSPDWQRFDYGFPFTDFGSFSIFTRLIRCPSICSMVNSSPDSVIVCLGSGRPPTRS